MARVTIEDALKVIPNKFELIHRAAKRAHQLADGATPKVTAGDDNVIVLALREIAAGHTNFDEETNTAEQTQS